MRRKTAAISLAIGTVIFAVGLVVVFWPSTPCMTTVGPPPPSCQPPPPYFIEVTVASLPFVGMTVMAISLAAMAFSFRRPISIGEQVLGGLLTSGAIFLVMFVVILGALFGEVQASNSTMLWVGIMYAPYLGIGATSLSRNQKAFGLTLILLGLIAAFAFRGFVYGISGSF